MPRTLGFMTLHYGKEYLKESLLSIKGSVDKMVISYVRYPSHGTGTNIPCPDEERYMKDIAQEVFGDDLIWSHNVMFSNESEHRAERYRYADGYDLILTIDADEVLVSDEIERALKYAYLNHERYYGIKGYVNLWRSFDYACYDGFRPIRIENLKNKNQLQNLECPLTIFHFSTCQSESIMRYKYKVFGHASEVRENWLDEIYYKWTPNNQFKDVHCVAFGIWNPQPIDKNHFPESLKKHPNFNKILV